MNKAELRNQYLAKRRQLTVLERETASAKIVFTLFRGIDFSKIDFLHCFISIERLVEIDTRPIFERIWTDYPQIQTVVPRINRETNELESLQYGPDVELVHNTWQIGEPAHDDRVDAEKIDIVLVPLLCFDRSGHRVGYGKGFYDRFLATCRPDCQKIGLCMFPPIDEISDAHEGDATLDACITPDGVYRFPAHFGGK